MRKSETKIDASKAGYFMTEIFSRPALLRQTLLWSLQLGKDEIGA